MRRGAISLDSDYEIIDDEKEPIPRQQKFRNTAIIKSSACINAISVDHNTWWNNWNGMLIHVDFDIKNFNQLKGEIASYFYFNDGVPLKDYDNEYKAPDGTVAVGAHFIPEFIDTNFRDFQLFIPYDQLHMAIGKHSLKFQVIIWDMSQPITRELTRSSWIGFWVEQK